jgi:hypothetical protein
VDVERLTLVDEGTLEKERADQPRCGRKGNDERETNAIGGEVDDGLLRDLPDGLVDALEVVGDAGDVLNRSVVSDEGVLHGIVPKTTVDEIAKKPWVDDLELSGEDTASVDVAVENARRLEMTMREKERRGERTKCRARKPR